jgi:DNA topoisomerase-1
MISEHFPNIVDLGFTARMEEDLDRIASGEHPWVRTLEEFYPTFSKQVADADARIPVMKNELEPVGRDCPECGHALVIRYGRYGKFISCSNFPDCRYTEAWLEKIGVKCPKDGGEIVERKTRKNRLFYGCANYPNCDFTSWKRPLPVPCPNCEGLLVIADKRNAQCLDCNEQFPLDQVTQDEVVESA